LLADEILIPERRGFPWRWALIGLAVVLVAGAGVYLWPILHRTTPDQTYVTAPVQRATLADSIAATGPIVAPTAVPLNFKNSGKLSEIDVQVGDAVKAGQILAKLEPGDLAQQLGQARANRDAAQAGYDKLVAGPQPADVQAVQAGIDAAARQLAAARDALKVEQEQLAADVAVADAAVGAAQTNLGLAQAGLAPAQAQAAKTLAADNTAVANAQKNLDAVQATVAANQPVLEQQVEKAKDDLWSTQTSRDATCGRSRGADCNAANASVAAAQTAVNSAQAQLVQTQKQETQQVTAAQTQLDQARAQLASDQTREDSAVSQARGQVQQANDAVKTAQKNAADARARAAVGLQAAQAQVSVATSAVQTAQAAYAKTTAPATSADLANAKALVAAQQALVDLAQANLDAATLSAPSAGVVTAINGAVGQWLTGGSTSGAAASAASGANNSSANSPGNFISLTNLSDLQVQAQVNEADVGRLSAGQAATFSVDAFPGQTFQGKVAIVQSLGATSQNVVSYPVLIAMTPTRAKLLPGMTANVTITVEQRPNVLVVPAAAIAFAQGQSASGSAGNAPLSASAGSSVLVVDTNGKTALQAIQAGASDGQNTEVLAGLKEGERVAVGVR
jgi:HlyD family secretion protein